MNVLTVIQVIFPFRELYTS